MSSCKAGLITFIIHAPIMLFYHTFLPDKDLAEIYFLVCDMKTNVFEELLFF